MEKSIAKEIIIGLLLCLAIILILSVLLYSYIPNNKVVPEAVAYTTPEEAKEVLNEAQVDTSKVILTYEMNGNDLSTAQKTNSYKAGKVNPFSTYKLEENNNNGTSGTANSGSTSSGGETSSQSSTGNSNNSSSASRTNNTNDSSIAGTNKAGTSSETENEGTSSSGTYYKDKGTK